MSEQELLLQLADDELVLGWRDSEWTGIAPFLEEDVAFSSIAQNEIGHARADLRAAGGRRRRARVRPRAGRVPRRRRSSSFASCPTGRGRSRAASSTRRRTRSGSSGSSAPTTPTSPGSRPRSTARRSTTACTRRCGRTGSRTSRASATPSTELLPYALGILDEEHRPALVERLPWEHGGRRGGRARHARRRVAGSLGRDDDGAPLRAGCGMVTEADVWQALGGDPRPGDPRRLARRPRRRARCPRRRRPRPRRVHADLPRLPGARGHARRDGRKHRRARRGAGRRSDHATTPGRPTGSRPRAARSSARRDSPRPRRARQVRRRSSSSRAGSSAARTAGRRTRRSRTSSARRRAARSATATPATSRTSTSRRSEPAGTVSTCARPSSQRRSRPSSSRSSRPAAAAIPTATRLPCRPRNGEAQTNRDLRALRPRDPAHPATESR